VLEVDARFVIAPEEASAGDAVDVEKCKQFCTLV